jgi:hypothetical protein
MMDIDDSFLEQEDQDISVEHEAAPFVKRFEGAAEEFGPGSTFMDNLDKDTYAYEHVYNLYYQLHLGTSGHWCHFSFVQT